MKPRILFAVATSSTILLTACSATGGYSQLSDAEIAAGIARKLEAEMTAASMENAAIAEDAAQSIEAQRPAGWDDETVLAAEGKAEAEGIEVEGLSEGALTNEERERLIAQREEREAAEEARRAEYRAMRLAAASEECGPEMERAMRDEVVVGMSAGCARFAWGQPTSVNRTVSEYGVREQWVYRGHRGRANYLYFRDGVLTSISTSD